MRLAFRVLGEPRGWARARLGKNGHHFTDKRTRAYEYEIAERGAFQSIAQHWPRAFGEPCALVVDAVFARPGDRMRKKDPTGRIPRERGRIDADNLGKAVMDGLQKGGVFKNDAQVVDLHVRLWWTAVDEAPCLEVEVRALEAHSASVEILRPIRMKGAFR